jgi:hypothetical protein
LIVLAVAVLITILGLLIVAWPGLTQPRQPQPSAPVTPSSSAPATTEVGLLVPTLTPGGQV